MSTPDSAPLISVVVPTYNRAELLRGTLTALAGQRMPAAQFEVVVADDGSTDDTRDCVHAFTDRLRVRYAYQEDLGFRAAAARNTGARLASGDVLVFVDTGVLPGPDFLAAHLAVHRRPGPSRAVIGYTYGYRPDDPTPGLDAALRSYGPEEVVRRFGATPAFQDARQPTFASIRYDLSRMPLPWSLFWTLNCSVPAADLRAVGGFDEDFRSWGGEDLELGIRLHRRGLAFEVSREAWAVDTPHPRSVTQDVGDNRSNMLTILRKHPEPETELMWAWFSRHLPQLADTRTWFVPQELPAIQRAIDRVRTRDVTAELTRLCDDVPPGARIAVFGCGPALPAGFPPAVLLDFDEQQLRHLPHDSRHQIHHSLGIRTVLPDDAVDVVLITSRMTPLWRRWGRHILAEAHRVGRTVRGAGTDLPG
ncbi:Glycosyltransferase, GT2 family [Micromonospora nigra]|uniref:Glycosyltransferase, GT2 family n=1 Tax=Micromonospora nigra TaxID=145857 RepID=A0A1C6S896_9ACTN|nr:glycosyltransferase [Micromonospora nigra]SCL25655.1 Glycosyltransferase, GT2 family [Micromonospora nigra]